MSHFTAQALLSRSPPPTIALPSKGRLALLAIEWAASQGISFTRAERQLEAIDAAGRRIFFVRAADVPLLVERGAVDCGVTGYDLLREKSRGLDYSPLGFGACRLSIAIPNNSSIRTLGELDGKVVATSFPYLTRYFFGDRGIDVGILELSGSVEAACGLGLADAIVDLVSTGESLKKNGLQELAVVAESQAVLCWRNR